MAAQRQFLVRSARASELAQCLAAREPRSIAHVVERAVDLYARHTMEQQSASEFYARLARNFVDMDLFAETRVFVAVIAYGVEKIRHEERSPRLQSSLGDRCRPFARRIYGFDGDASLIYSPIMGMAYRMGCRVAVPDGMIGAVALRKKRLTGNTEYRALHPDRLVADQSLGRPVILSI